MELMCTGMRIDEWESMTGVEQTCWLEKNSPLTNKGMSRLKAISGVGVNDAGYSTQPSIEGNRVICPAYKTWRDLIRRCYSEKVKIKHPTYRNARADIEWHSFMSFRSWWLIHHVDGWQIDKDLLFAGNKTYGPNQCLFVPAWVNNILVNGDTQKGEFLLGVSKSPSGDTYHASISIAGGKRNLGAFNTIIDAHLAYQSAKLAYIDELKPKLDDIDCRLYPSIRSQVSGRTVQDGRL